MERMNKITSHWLEEILYDYNIKSRYELEKLGRLSQSTTSDIIKNNTSIHKISVETLYKIVLAIAKNNETLNYNKVLIDIIDKYY